MTTYQRLVLRSLLLLLYMGARTNNDHDSGASAVIGDIEATLEKDA